VIPPDERRLVIIKDQRDFVAGIMFVTIGIAFAIGATRYSFGTAGRMGPGYFPLVLGLLLAFLGSIVVVKALVHQPEGQAAADPWPWKAIIFILGANILFGVLIGGLPSIGLPPMGLIVAIVAVTFVASLASTQWSWRNVTLLALVLVGGSYVIFVMLLRLVLPILPEWD
jgi:hypothetical protein